MYRETVALEDGFRLELVLEDRRQWSLSLFRGAQRVVEYRSGTPYEFKSVEKLRYDFERDAQDARHPR